MENIELLTGTVAGKTAVALHGHGWCEGSSAMASGKPFGEAFVGRGGRSYDGLRCVCLPPLETTALSLGHGS